jgi:hypothetical protein
MGDTYLCHGGTPDNLRCKCEHEHKHTWLHENIKHTWFHYRRSGIDLVVTGYEHIRIPMLLEYCSHWSACKRKVKASCDELDTLRAGFLL